MHRIYALIALAALYAAPAAAQARRDGAPGQGGVSIGIGVGVEPLSLFEVTKAGSLTGAVTSGGVAPVGIYVPVQISPQLRIEPVVGFWHASGNRAAVNIGNGDLVSGSATSLGVGGLFFLSAPAPTGFYVGLRAALNFQSGDFAAGGGTVNTFKETDFSLAPVFGGEYAFAQHFSVGAEAQLPITWYGNPSSETAGLTVTPNNDRTGIRTNAVVFFRYFFM